MRLRTAVFVLVCGTAVAFVAAVGAAGAMWGWGVLTPAVLGVAITLPTSVVSLLGVVKVSALKPDFVPIAALSATFLRMVWAVGVVALLRGRAADFDTTADVIAGWTTSFYVVTLFVETALVWWMLTRPRGVTDDPRTPAGPESGQRG